VSNPHHPKNSMNDRALVLGGGGVAGIAWMTGVLFGLSERNIDLRQAELILGTSAGSALAAQLGSPLSLQQLFRRQVHPALQTREITPDPRLREKLLGAIPAMVLPDRAESARQFGRWALQAPTVPEAERRSVVAERLPSHSWPDKLLRIVAVDTETGETRIFDRFSGAELIDAVAASCAVPGVWPPVTINGHRYMDGAVRSAGNADLAKGYARIVILSPFGTRPDEIVGIPLKEQTETLEKAGAMTYLIEPDNTSRDAIGMNALLPETRQPAAEAGRNQGQAIAKALAPFWTATLSG
jgi:NTE family protein